MGAKTRILVASALLTLLILACGTSEPAEPEVVTVIVTEQVEITRQVTVEVTREVVVIVTATSTDTPPGPTPTPTATRTPRPTSTPRPTATPLPSDTPIPPPAAPPPTEEPPPAAAVCDCSGDNYNCGDFSTHAAAQACYNYCISIGAGDVHDLDRDNDGSACDNLP